MAFSAVSGGLSEPLLLLSVEGRVIDANSAALATLGRRDLAGLKGALLPDMCDDPEAARTLVARWARSGHPTPGRLVLKKDSGQSIESLCRGWLVRGELDATRYILLECRPKNEYPDRFMELNQRIAELRRELALQMELQDERSRLLELEQIARVEAEEASRQKGEFLELISHELRTPISTIYGYASIMSTDWQGLSDADRETSFRDVWAEAGRLRRIIENLLVLARVDAERSPRMIAVRLQDLLREYGHAFERQHSRRPLRLDLDESAPAVQAVPEHLEIVVMNLLSNAERYSPPDTVIELRYSVTPEGPRISIIDQGPGLDGDMGEALFAPFTRSAGIGGIGLGLAVCKRLVEAVGGRIWASPNPEGGSIFSFVLPAEDRSVSQ